MRRCLGGILGRRRDSKCSSWFSIVLLLKDEGL